MQIFLLGYTTHSTNRKVIVIHVRVCTSPAKGVGFSMKNMRGMVRCFVLLHSNKGVPVYFKKKMDCLFRDS